MARAAGWMLAAGAVLRIGGWIAVASGGAGLGYMGAWLFGGLAGMLEGAAGLMALCSTSPWRAFVLPMACSFLLAAIQRWGAQAGLPWPEALPVDVSDWMGWACGAGRAMTPWTWTGCGTALVLAGLGYRARHARTGDDNRAGRWQMQKDRRVTVAEGKAGFTLVGLSMTVLVLCVLVALFAPAILRARGLMRTKACLGQARQLGFAIDLYASDHDDRFPPNKPGVDVPQGQTWVQGWMGSSGPDCTNVCHLRDALLAPYIRGTSKWKCPEAGPVRMSGRTVTKVRSFSINGFLGSECVLPLATTFRKRSDIAPMSPSRLLAFVEERPETLDDGTFEMQWDFDVAMPWEWVLRDQPSVNHGLAGNLTWVDGHAATHRWLDMARIPRQRPPHPAPGHPDVLWLQAHGTWRPQVPMAGR